MKFKKIMSVLASAVMLSSTVGFAAAAAYPEPFVVGGTADSAIIVGANAAVSDWAAAIDVQSNLQGLVTTTTGTSIVTGGSSWKVGTSSDTLEIGESLVDITSYIDKDDFSLLASGELSNEKGTAKYSQYFYFGDTTASHVNYTKNDDDVPGLYLKFKSGEGIARYVMDFSSNLKSDVLTTNHYEDIEDKEITILGKSYVITNALNSSATNTDLTLMSGANKGTVNNDEEVTVGTKKVSVVVSATNAAQFTIDGETTTKLAEGDTYKLNDGSYLGVTDITYQNFAGGLMQSTIYLGADKLFLDDGSNLQVNAQTISNAQVVINETFSDNDVSITRIEINMTAEDDLYVPVNGKLSENPELDKPAVMLTQNWDIEFKGTEVVNTEIVKLNPTGSDKKYELSFINYDGQNVVIPLLWANNTGTYGGYDESKKLILNCSGPSTPITKDDYFILNTADPTDDTTNARSYVVKYTGADKASDTSPQVRFTVVGGSDQEVSLASDGTSTLKLGGTTFNFINVSSCNSGTNCNMILNGNARTSGHNQTNMAAYLRTKYNALITINDTNHNMTGDATGGTGHGSSWIVELDIDDASRDGDDWDLSTAASPEEVWKVTFGNTTDADISASISWSADAVTDPSNSDKSTYQTKHGVFIEDVDASGSPLILTSKIPDGYVKPLVYVTTGEVVVTPGTTGSGGTILVVKDSEVSSVSGKNLVVIGGSCINTAAAKILGSEVPLCGADFTEKTKVGAGQYLIKSVASPYAATGSTKVAMLVAGYDAADTENAVAKALTGVSSLAGTEQVYPITSA